MSFPHLTTVTPFEDNVTDVLAEDQIHHAIFGDIQVSALPTAITWSATAGSTGQTLICSGATFVSSGVVAWHVAYNSTDGSYSIVKSVDSETQITTTPLKWGSANVWASGNSFSLKAAPYMRVCLTQTDGANQSGTYIRNSANNAWVNLSPVTTTLWSDNTTIPTSKAVKDVTDLKAPLASPALTGTPTAPTASAGNNSTQIATTGYVDNAISKVPTYTVTDKTSIGGIFNGDFEIGTGSQSSTGWIGSEYYGWCVFGIAGTVSASYDTAVLFSGTKSLKVSTTATASYIEVHQTPGWSVSEIAKYLPRIKPSTKYRLSYRMKTKAVSGDSNHGAALAALVIDSTWGIAASHTQSYIKTTTDWTYYTAEFTSTSTAAYVDFRPTVYGHTGAATLIMDAWFDSVQLEEVIEMTNDNLLSKEQGVIGYTAVGTTDNVDQYQTSLTSDENLGIIGKLTQYQKASQTFVPTKAKHTGVVIRRQSSSGSFTGNIVVNVETTSGGAPTWTVLASYTIPNATWQAATANVTDITVPLTCILTPGTTYAYTFASSAALSDTNFTNISMHSSNSYASWQWAGYNGSGWGTLGYNFDIYFKTLYYKPTTGFHSSMHNVSNLLTTDSDGMIGWSKLDLINGTYSLDTGNNFASISPQNFAPCFYSVTAIWAPLLTVTSSYIDSVSAFVLKVNIPLQTKNWMRVHWTKYNGTARQNRFSYSFDWLQYSTPISCVWSWWVEEVFIVPWQFKTVYLKFDTPIADLVSFLWLKLFADVDTSPIKTLYAYPTNKDIAQTYTKLIHTATTTATYRASKYGFPAIEYADGVYQFLQVDTTSATYVKFSPDGTTYTTMSDGSSITLSSTTFPVVYTIVKIPTNRLLQSSDDSNNDATKDPSLKGNVTVLDKVQGLKYDVEQLQSTVNEMRGSKYDWVDWTATVSGSGSMTVSVGTYELTRYKLLSDSLAMIAIRLSSITTWGTASGQIYVSIPLDIEEWFGGIAGFWSCAITNPTGTRALGLVSYNASLGVLQFSKSDVSNLTLGSGGQIVCNIIVPIK